MNSIADVTVTPCSESVYIKPLRVFYKQNGVSKTWDAVKSHDSVCILLYNKTTESFVFVKQFRPAIYIQKSELQKCEDHWKVDCEKYPGELGVTYELCAGIVDKDKTLDVIAQEEILEECGFQVPLEKLERITSYRSGEGTVGALLTLFYAEVTEKMQVSSGGGNPEEGEMIELIEIPLKDIKHWLMDESVSKPATLMSGVGTSGSLQTLFYAEVTNEMRVMEGGGNADEGELIEVVEIPVKESRSLILDDENVTKPVGLMYALMWFYENKP